jgi:hypothetical protein
MKPRTRGLMTMETSVGTGAATGVAARNSEIVVRVTQQHNRRPGTETKTKTPGRARRYEIA